MAVTGIDHIAITVTDVEATVAWYQRVLRAEPLYLDLWRAGQIPIVILQVGTSRLSIHDAAKPSKPGAKVPTVGSTDLGLRWDGPISTAITSLGPRSTWPPSVWRPSRSRSLR